VTELRVSILRSHSAAQGRSSLQQRALPEVRHKHGQGVGPSVRFAQGEATGQQCGNSRSEDGTACVHVDEDRSLFYCRAMMHTTGRNEHAYV